MAHLRFVSKRVWENRVQVTLHERIHDTAHEIVRSRERVVDTVASLWPIQGRGSLVQFHTAAKDFSLFDSLRLAQESTQFPTQ